jgi:hypothetical protein
LTREQAILVLRSKSNASSPVNSRSSAIALKASKKGDVVFQKILKIVLVCACVLSAVSSASVKIQTSPGQIVASDDPKGGTGSG